MRTYTLEHLRDGTGFHKALDAFCDAAGLDYAGFAKVLGVDDSTMRRWTTRNERSYRLPSRVHRSMIAECFERLGVIEVGE